MAYKDTTYYVSSHGEPPKGRNSDCGIAFAGNPCTENKTVRSFKMATCTSHATQYAWETKGYIK